MADEQVQAPEAEVQDSPRITFRLSSKERALLDKMIQYHQAVGNDQVRDISSYIRYLLNADITRAVEQAKKRRSV